jgi:uncharacterized membrane protein YhaH (DUF805 family)
MDPIALFTSTQGRLAPKPFALALLAIYLASIASQALLSGAVMARAGLWPFILVQAALIWAWTMLHIKRLRDAGQGPTAAIGVALIYALAVALMALVIAFFTAPPAAVQPGEEPSGNAALGLLVVLAVFALLFSPDLGAFTVILKILVLIACLPVVISLLFSLRTGLRPSVAQ